MRRCLSLAVFLLVVAGPAHALVVSDPGAYARMAQQIQQLQDQVKQMVNVVNEAKRINANLSGNLQRGLGTEEDIRRLKGAVEKMLPTFTSQGVPNPNQSDMERIGNQLDKIFISSQAQPVEAELTKDQRDAYRKKAISNAVRYSEYVITDTEKSMNRLEDLSQQINQTQTMKDAQDLTNRYMQEMMANQVKLNLLLAQLVRAESAAKMQGVRQFVRRGQLPVNGMVVLVYEILFPFCINKAFICCTAMFFFYASMKVKVLLMGSRLVFVFILGKNISDSRMREIARQLESSRQSVFILSAPTKALYQRYLGFLENVPVYNCKDYVEPSDAWGHLHGFKSVWVFSEDSDEQYDTRYVQSIPSIHLLGNYEQPLAATS